MNTKMKNERIGGGGGSTASVLDKLNETLFLFAEWPILWWPLHMSHVKMTGHRAQGYCQGCLSKSLHRFPFNESRPFDPFESLQLKSGVHWQLKGIPITLQSVTILLPIPRGNVSLCRLIKWHENTLCILCLKRSHVWLDHSEHVLLL